MNSGDKIQKSVEAVKTAFSAEKKSRFYEFLFPHTSTVDKCVFRTYRMCLLTTYMYDVHVSTQSSRITRRRKNMKKIEWYACMLAAISGKDNFRRRSNLRKKKKPPKTRNIFLGK